MQGISPFWYVTVGLAVVTILAFLWASKTSKRTVAKKAEAPAAVPSAAVAEKTTPAPAAAPGTWAVQVVALSNRAAADAVVRRLVGKGYQAFLVAPQPGAPSQSYKVQVGRFNDRAEAEKMKLRLKRDEQFEPIVLR